MEPKELDAAIDDYLEECLSEADAARLSGLLVESPEARKRFWEMAAIHAQLEPALQQRSIQFVTGSEAPGSRESDGNFSSLDLALTDVDKPSPRPVGEETAASSQPIRGPWWQRRPLSAMAAGVVFGMFFSSAVWAYVAPMAAKAVTLFRDSFESGQAPLVKGMPFEPKNWSGDFSEVVVEQQGVKPKTGAKMLRLLRADYEGKTKHEGNYYADVYRLIDMRPHRNDLTDGGAAVRLSALFNAFAFPQEEGFWCSVAIHALGSPFALDRDPQREWAIYSNSLAMVRDRRTKLDRDPVTWQRVDAELRLPPDTEFLLIRLSVDHAHPSQRRATFDGHYLDDVRLDLVRRSPLP